MPRLKKISEFETMLLESARQAVEIAEGKLEGRVTTRELPVAEARAKLNLPRAEFARLLGVSPRTIENWEQNRRHPRGAAKVLIAVALRDPQLILSVLT